MFGPAVKTGACVADQLLLPIQLPADTRPQRWLVLTQGSASMPLHGILTPGFQLDPARSSVSTENEPSGKGIG